MGLYAVLRWAPVFPNHRLFLFMDNTASTCMINSGSLHSMLAVKCLRSLSCIAMMYNVAVEAFYIPGDFNRIADSISRFHTRGQIARFVSLLHHAQLPVPIDNMYCITKHMSLKAALFISPQVLWWQTLVRSWMQRWYTGGSAPWQNPQKRIISVTQGYSCNSVER